MKYKFVINEDNYSPAMVYEGLVRTAFNRCGKAHDPWGYASQDFYTSNLISEPTSEKGKRALSTTLIKLIIDNAQSAQADRLKSLENKVWKAKDQADINKIVREAIEAIKTIPA